jgi:hypothetical protein
MRCVPLWLLHNLSWSWQYNHQECHVVRGNHRQWEHFRYVRHYPSAASALHDLPDLSRGRCWIECPGRCTERAFLLVYCWVNTVVALLAWESHRVRSNYICAKHNTRYHGPCTMVRTRSGRFDSSKAHCFLVTHECGTFESYSRVQAELNAVIGSCHGNIEEITSPAVSPKAATCRRYIR